MRPLFVTPDFGAMTGGAWLLYVTAVSVLALVVFGIWRPIQKLAGPDRKAAIVVCVTVAVVAAGLLVWMTYWSQ